VENKSNNTDDALRPLEAQMIKRDLRELDAFGAAIEAAVAQEVARDKAAICREYEVPGEGLER
jgi:hypothetical protein